MVRRQQQPVSPPVSARAAEPPRPWTLAMLLAWIALFLAVSLTPLTNNDIWLHLANGEWILAHGRVPLTDPYSFTAEGNRFYAHEWLAGVIFELVHRAGGVNGLIFFKTLLGAVAMALAARAARRQGAGWLPLLASLGVVLAIVNSRFLERPEMFSYAVTSLYVLVLDREHRRLTAEGPASTVAWSLVARPRALLGASLLWPLVPLQWAWVQIHGYFLTGLGLLGLFLAAAAGTRLVQRLRTGTGSVLTPRLVSGGVALVLMIVMGLLNPNGWEIYTFPFELAGGDNIFMRTIFEWKPTFTTRTMTQSSMFLGFCLWLALLVIGCLDAPGLLRRRTLWRVAGGVSLAGLLILRVPLAAARDGRGSAWLWSPGEILHRIGAGTHLPAALEALLSPLRWISPAGDDLFTLLLLALLAWLAAAWRRPAAAGLAALAALLTFLYLQAGEGLAAWLRPMSAPVAVAGLLVVTVGPALIGAVGRGAVPAWQAVIAVAFLVLAVRQNRNIVNFALVTLPLVAPALARLARAVAATREPEAAGVTHRPRLAAGSLAASFALLTVLTVTSGWPYTPAVSKRVGLGLGPQIPVQAVRYIQDNGIAGRVFNKYAYGAYLIHELFPETRVYMDSRNDVYGPDLYRTYLEALARPEVARRVFQENDFDYVLVDYNLYPGRSEDTGLFTYLAGQDRWVLVYFDDTSVLYLRDNHKHAELIARHGYSLVNPVEFRPRRAQELEPDTLERYVDESRRAVERRPDSLAAHLIRADALLAARQPDPAMEALEAALRIDPDNLFSLVTGARLARVLGREERARELYQRAHRLRPDLDDLRLELEALNGGTSG